jgi:hypothetical protein
VVDTLYKALSDTLATPEIRQAIEAAGGTLPPSTMTLAQASAYYQAETEKLTALATAAKLEAN